MIATTANKIGKNLTLVRHGTFGAPEGAEAWETTRVPILSRLTFDGQGNARCLPFHSVLSAFNLLPAAALAVGKDPDYLTLGAGTEVVTRAAKGGANIQTQASTPANGNDAMVIGISTNATFVPLRAAARGQFSTRVSLTQITLELFFAGLNQTITVVDPTGSAGDGVGFLFDPTNATTTGLASGIYTKNWLAYQKVNGVDTFADTGVAVVAGQDFELDVEFDAGLVPSYYINGNLVAAGFGVAGTADASLGALVGVKIIDGGSVVQHDFDIRHLIVAREIG